MSALPCSKKRLAGVKDIDGTIFRVAVHVHCYSLHVSTFGGATLAPRPSPPAARSHGRGRLRAGRLAGRRVGSSSRGRRPRHAREYLIPRATIEQPPRAARRSPGNDIDHVHYRILPIDRPRPCRRLPVSTVGPSRDGAAVAPAGFHRRGAPRGRLLRREYPRQFARLPRLELRPAGISRRPPVAKIERRESPPAAAGATGAIVHPHAVAQFGAALPDAR
jgi:hypothetical protein